jgi:hypothetical protein
MLDKDSVVALSSTASRLKREIVSAFALREAVVDDTVCQLTNRFSYLLIEPNPHKLNHIIEMLGKSGIDSFLLFPKHHYDYGFEMPESFDVFVAASCVNVDTSQRPFFHYLEMHICDRCNLNCKACSHFSPLVGGDAPYPSIETFKNDLNRISALFSGLCQLRLMGGEPLLNPMLNRFVDVARRCFPHTDLRVVTNGLLVKNLDNDAIGCLRDNKVVLDISNYAPTSYISDDLVSLLRGNGIAFSFNQGQVATSFLKLFALDAEGVKPYGGCPTGGFCANLRDGMLAKCPLLMYIDTFNGHFGTNLPNDGRIDIHQEGVSGFGIMDRLKGEVPLCRHCVGSVRTPWSRYDGAKPAINDWVIDTE